MGGLQVLQAELPGRVSRMSRKERPLNPYIVLAVGPEGYACPVPTQCPSKLPACIAMHSLIAFPRLPASLRPDGMPIKALNCCKLAQRSGQNVWLIMGREGLCQVCSQQQ